MVKHRLTLVPPVVLNDLGIGVDELPVCWISVAAAHSVQYVTSDWSVTIRRPETGAFGFAPLAPCFLLALLSPPQGWAGPVIRRTSCGSGSAEVCLPVSAA